MKARVKRTMARALAGIGVTACAVMGVTSGTASAGSSPYIESKSHDCAAKWYAPGNTFYIDDQDLDDNKRCTVKYSLWWDKNPYVIPDPGDRAFWEFEVKGADDERWVFFQVCDWRGVEENCSGWKQYGT